MERMLGHPKRRAVDFEQDCLKIERADYGQVAHPGMLSDSEHSSKRSSNNPLLRAGTLVSLHLLWAMIAGTVTIVFGFGIASLIANSVPVPRRYLAAGVITTLALGAAWLGPGVVERLVASRRLMCASDQVARLWSNVDRRRV